MTVEFAISHRNIAFPTIGAWFMCSCEPRVCGFHAAVAQADEPSQNQRA